MLPAITAVLLSDKEKFHNSGRVTTCPGMPGTVPEWEGAVPRPGQCRSGTIKCPGMRIAASNIDYGIVELS